MISQKSFYYSLLQTPAISLYGATFLALGFLVGVWWYLLYCPMEFSCRRMYQELDQISCNMSALKKYQQELDQLAGQHATLEARLKKYADKKSNEQDGRQLASLADEAMRAGLMVNGCRSTNDQCMLDAQGSLDAVLTFFESCDRAVGMLTCMRTSLTKYDTHDYSLQMAFKK